MCKILPAGTQNEQEANNLPISSLFGKWGWACTGENIHVVAVMARKSHPEANMVCFPTLSMLLSCWSDNSPSQPSGMDNSLPAQPDCLHKQLWGRWGLEQWPNDFSSSNLYLLLQQTTCYASQLISCLILCTFYHVCSSNSDGAPLSHALPPVLDNCESWKYIILLPSKCLLLLILILKHLH